ncbi:MAG: NfeD family protein [Bacteroidales bacterium]|nr:NfeD family protein [Bacteroidales bacterium]
MGILLLLVEILLLPGVNVAGIIGLLFMAAGVYVGYQQGPVQGHVALLFASVASVVMAVYALRPKTWRRVALQERIDSQAGPNMGSHVRVGDEGITLSRLAPMGKALIGEQTVEVSTVGELIDPQQPIVVVKVEEGRIVVKPKKIISDD